MWRFLRSLGAHGADWVGVLFRPAARARRRARRAVRRISKAVGALDAAEGEAAAALERAAGAYAEEAADERLRSIDVEELRRFGADRIRWEVLREAGYRSVADLTGTSRARLLALDGIGPKSVTRLARARKALLAAHEDEPVPLPAVGAEDAAVDRVLVATAHLRQVREELREPRGRLGAARGEAARLLQEVERGTSLWNRLRRRVGAEERDAAIETAARVTDLADELRRTGELARARKLRRSLRRLPRPAVEVARREHELHYADYCALIERALAARGGHGERGLPGPQGGLPRTIARAVERLELSVRGMRVTLRGYQEFGAKYLVVQERTLLGDEMGLGKTVEALSACTHLAETGAGGRFLVVAPASVLHNWVREIASRSSLRPFLLHGSRREEELDRWRAAGGVAVTSFGTLGTLSLVVDGADHAAPDMLIVDEAHYVKNPEAGRTRSIAAVAARAPRVCFMTGTPIENRLEEFRNLVGLLRPAVARELGGGAVTGDLAVGRGAFQRAVAPVYLRRNQSDVLTEMPERVDKEEWVELGADERGAYRDAVLRRDLMAMRRAAAIGADGTASAKLERLGELLDEYRETGAKVIVFSYFLDVLKAVGRRFDCHGPITGAVPAAGRLELCDAFQGADGHAILLAQIVAGGVGLNLQAASVVVLVEPQWKPSSEDQAVARAHRMGQTRTVVVHRLLARDSVDERMREALAEKRELFDAFARESEIVRASAAATETELQRRVLEEEYERVTGSAPTGA